MKVFSILFFFLHFCIIIRQLAGDKGMWVKFLIYPTFGVHNIFKLLWVMETVTYLSLWNYLSFEAYWGRNACQMWQVFWHMISNDAKWFHGPMCSGVKQGCPDQPLTPGSFIRLCSRHDYIGKGHWKGRRLPFFTSIQLKHQQLNRCLVFNGTLIVSFDWQVIQKKCPLSETH